MASDVLNLPPDLAAKIDERIESGEAADAVDVCVLAWLRLTRLTWRNWKGCARKSPAP